MSAGRDVRGIKRGHQFDKVELVKFCAREESWDELDSLLDAALAIVQALGFRYRVVRLASEDLGFASAMSYDIEIWAPGSREWLEVSSCSNFLDFQARRGEPALPRRRWEGAAPAHPHGSGLGLARTLATLLEQYEGPEGIAVPEVLQPYLGGATTIGAEATP